MKLFDSHSHVNDKAFKNDYNSVLENAAQAGVAAMMIVGISEKSSEIAVDLAQKHFQYFASVGVHPHVVKYMTHKSLPFLKKLASNNKVKAFGEIGLDFNRMFSSQEEQENWFLKQLELADELNLPLIFHERDTKGRFLELLKANHRDGRKGVVHCFGGTAKEMEEYLDLGYSIGITGIVTLKGRGDNLRALIPSIPLDRILIETDCPYLTPYPDKIKEKRNEPAFVKSVLLKIAEIVNKDSEQLANTIWNNTCHLFNIEDMLVESVYDKYLI